MSEVRTAGQVVTLRDATAPEFGGKAKALAAALEARLPVPDGIALDADLVARVVAGEPIARDALTKALATVPSPWAVRSSAIGEDSANASFAGQHSTVLGVEPGALFDAIASVHASGQTAAAQAYRAKMGVIGAARMGIVIQTLLRPDISGVLFSRDPTATREGRVIEATWGLGEALVSGLVTPDRYHVATDGKVIERAIGEKDVAIEARDGGGTAEVEIKGDRVRAACLDMRGLPSCAAREPVRADLRWPTGPRVGRREWATALAAEPSRHHEPVMAARHAVLPQGATTTPGGRECQRRAPS